MRHSTSNLIAGIAVGALAVSGARADAFKWNNEGSGAAYWGNTNKWVKVSGEGAHTVPSMAGDSATIPHFLGTFNPAVAAGDGSATNFTLRAITVESSSQTRRIGNPSSGTSTLVFDNSGSEQNTISVTMNGSDRVFAIADRVNIQLNQTLRCTHGSNIHTPIAIHGVVSGPGGIEVTGLAHHLRLANVNTYAGDTRVFGTNRGFTGTDAWEKSLFADGGASASGSSTGTGQVILTGSAASEDFHRPILRGNGVVGQTGRTGTTLTLGSSSTDARSFPCVSPGGTLTAGGGRTATIGILTVNGDVVFGAGSRLDAEYGDEIADVLRINGGLVLNATNTVLVTTRLGGTDGTLADVYELVHYAAGRLTGKFAAETLAAELLDAGYRVFYNQASSLGPAYAAIVLAKPPSGTLILLR